MKKIITVLLTTFVSVNIFAFDLDSLLIKSKGGYEGLEQFKKITSFEFVGSIDMNGMLAKLETKYVYPDKVYTILKFEHFEIIEANDGETAWKVDYNGHYSELGEVDKKSMREILYFYSLSDVADDRFPGDKWYEGLEEINGQACHKVGFSPFYEDTVYNYYDTLTGYNLFSVSYEDNLRTVSSYSDYRIIDKMPVHHRNITRIDDANYRSSMILIDVKFNTDIDPEIFKGKVNSEPDYVFPENLTEVKIPINIVNNQIHFIAIVNGAEKVRVLLDSGASTNTYNKPVFDKLNLPVIGSIPSIGIGGADEMSIIRIDSIQIGEVTLLNQVGGLVDLSSLDSFISNEMPFGGIIGYDFLSRFPIMIDFSKSEMIIYNPNEFKPDTSGLVLPFDLNMQVPAVEGFVGERSGDFIVDLGNSFGLILHHSFVAQQEIRRHLQLLDKYLLIGGIGGDSKGQLAILDSFQMGGLVLNDLEIMIPDSTAGLSGTQKIAGNIGLKLLKNYRLLFDYPGQRLILYDK